MHDGRQFVWKWEGRNCRALPEPEAYKCCTDDLISHEDATWGVAVTILHLLLRMALQQQAHSPCIDLPKPLSNRVFPCVGAFGAKTDDVVARNAALHFASRRCGATHAHAHAPPTVHWVVRHEVLQAGDVQP